MCHKTRFNYLTSNNEVRTCDGYRVSHSSSCNEDREGGVLVTVMLPLRLSQKPEKKVYVVNLARKYNFPVKKFSHLENVTFFFTRAILFFNTFVTECTKVHDFRIKRTVKHEPHFLCVRHSIRVRCRACHFFLGTATRKKAIYSVRVRQIPHR